MAEALLTYSVDSILLVTLDGTILRANPAACAVLGRSEQELKRLGRDGILVPDENTERMLAERERTATVRGEVVFRRADGTTFPAELTSTVVSRRTGEPVALAIFHDLSPQRRVERELSVAAEEITARKRTEDALRRSEERFHTLADNIAQLAWMADGRGALVWFNKRWFDYTGTTFDDVEGHGWRTLLHPDHAGRVLERAARGVRTGEPWEDTFPLRGRDGAYRWFLCRATPIRDGHGGALRWFGTNTDITELREAQQALREADERKTNFLAVLSHELRNPLAAIQNGLSLLDRTPGTEQTGRVRAIVRRQLDHVTRLVDDLLDISRISHGKIALQRSRLDVRQVVRGACDGARAAFEERRVALRLDLTPEPLWVDADQTRLTQVVGNLLGNALKFTSPPGEVDVRLRARGAEAELRVRDTGAGIEPHLLDAIFEPFAQADPGRAPSGGMGIGLALVKTFVTMHEGWVRAESAGDGRGAEFVVSLPLAEPAEGTTDEDGLPAPCRAPPAARPPAPPASLH
jgi:PAS domain S-box-containing protein